MSSSLLDQRAASDTPFLMLVNLISYPVKQWLECDGKITKRSVSINKIHQPCSVLPESSTRAECRGILLSIKFVTLSGQTLGCIYEFLALWMCAWLSGCIWSSLRLFDDACVFFHVPCVWSCYAVNSILIFLWGSSILYFYHFEMYAIT